jgi:hypothetical protein
VEIIVKPPEKYEFTLILTLDEIDKLTDELDRLMVDADFFPDLTARLYNSLMEKLPHG